LTPSDSQSTAKSSQKSDDELALALSEFSRLASNWKAASEWIKRAGLFEQRVIAPHVDGLRYAQKRLADARELINAEDFGAARVHLEQANESIYKTRRDVIDGALAFIGSAVKRYANDLGHANLNDHFGHYQEFWGLFTRIRRQIANSGANRERRDELYRGISEGSDFKDLLRYFDELRGSAFAISKSIEKHDREFGELRVRWAIGIGVTVILGVVGAALLIIFNV